MQIDHIHNKNSEPRRISDGVPQGVRVPSNTCSRYLSGWHDSVVPDYFVSSHTPTIAALLTAVLPPQLNTLPCTVQELQNIEGHVHHESLVRLDIQGRLYMVSHLSSTSIAHFVCHGH